MSASGDRATAGRLPQHEPRGVDRGTGVRGAAHGVGPHPAAGDHDGAQPTVDLEQLHERRVADLVDQAARRRGPPGPAAARSVAPTSRRRCWIAFSSRARSRSSTRRRLVVVAGLGQPAVVGAQRGQQPGELAVVRRPQRGLGQRRGPPPLAPPQLRRVAVRATAWRQRQPGQLVPAHRGQRAQLGAPQRGPMVVQCVQPAAAGVPHATSVADLVPVERLGQPGRGTDQPRRVSTVAGGRGPQLRRVVRPTSAAARPASSHATGASSDRASSSGHGQPCGASASALPSHRDGAGPTSTTSSARSLSPPRRPWRRKLRRADRAATSAASASPRASSAERQVAAAPRLG